MADQAGIINSTTGTIVPVNNALVETSPGVWALQAAAPGYVPESRTISTTAPLTGGGDLSTNRTIAIPAATPSVNGYMSAAYATVVAGFSTFGKSLGAAVDAAAAKVLLALGNVDNTSDVNKPVSTAQATADGLRVLKAGDTMSGLLTASAGVIDSTVVSGEILIAHTLGRIKSSAAFLFDWSTGNVTHVGNFKTNKVGAGTDPSAASGTKLVAGTSAGNFGSSTAVAHFIDNTVNATVNFQNTNAAGYTAFDLFNSAGVKVATYAWSNASAGLYPNALWFMTRIAGDMILGTNSVERLRLSAAGVIIGAAGTALSQAKVYTPTLTPTDVTAADEYNEQYFTVTGLTTADTVFVNPPAMSGAPHSQLIAFRVSAADTLALTFRSVSGTHPPPQGVYRVIAIRS